jgi:hypothetical protein
MSQPRRDPTALLWRALTPLLGLNLWAVLALAPCQLEWLDPEARLWAVALYLLPLPTLVVCSLLRWSFASLAVFPTSLLPALLLLPEADQLVLQSPEGFFSVGASLVLYLVAAARWLNLERRDEQLHLAIARLRGDAAAAASQPPDGRALEATPIERPPLRRDLWWPYQHHFAPRWALMAALLVTWIVGLNFREDSAARALDAFGGDATQARVLLNLLFLFIWVVAMYLFFYSPGLNLELEQRAADAALMGLQNRVEQEARGLKAAGLALALGLCVAALWWWRG